MPKADKEPQICTKTEHNLLLSRIEHDHNRPLRLCTICKDIRYLPDRDKVLQIAENLYCYRT